MPNLSVEQVKARLESIRLGIQTADLNLNREVTASFGVAQLNKIHSIKQVIDKADKALYQAKSEGRNCVKFSE
ncbi:MAG: diguanylate cyclase [Saccharospirillaceae bacterium]|nr:diguanylate cyclase [Saccharospirillaceae bacterium]